MREVNGQSETRLGTYRGKRDRPTKCRHGLHPWQRGIETYAAPPLMFCLVPGNMLDLGSSFPYTIKKKYYDTRAPPPQVLHSTSTTTLDITSKWDNRQIQSLLKSRCDWRLSSFSNAFSLEPDVGTSEPRALP